MPTRHWLWPWLVFGYLPKPLFPQVQLFTGTSTCPGDCLKIKILEKTLTLFSFPIIDCVKCSYTNISKAVSQATKPNCSTAPSSDSAAQSITVHWRVFSWYRQALSRQLCCLSQVSLDFIDRVPVNESMQTDPVQHWRLQCLSHLGSLLYFFMLTDSSD